MCLQQRGISGQGRELLLCTFRGNTILPFVPHTSFQDFYFYEDMGSSLCLTVKTFLDILRGVGADGSSVTAVISLSGRHLKVSGSCFRCQWLTDRAGLISVLCFQTCTSDGSIHSTIIWSKWTEKNGNVSHVLMVWQTKTEQEENTKENLCIYKLISYMRGKNTGIKCWNIAIKRST